MVDDADAAGGAQACGQDQGFAPRQVRDFPSEAEMAAARPESALAVERTASQRVIDSADLGQRSFNTGRVQATELGLTRHRCPLTSERPLAQPRRMKLIRLAALIALTLPLLACGADPSAPGASESPNPKKPAGSPVTQPPMTETQQTATFATGCFWCTEAVFQRIKGVEKVVSGYIGGSVKNPTYDEVCEGTTGHAEAVQITFNPKVVGYDKLLEVFWASHDPTTLNRQGHDVGTQYRSGVFFHSDDQKKTAEASKAKHQADFKDPIVTEITKADVFYPAEGYHQNYFNLNSSRNPYCRIVIWPKLKKLGLEVKPAE